MQATCRIQVARALGLDQFQLEGSPTALTPSSKPLQQQASSFLPLSCPPSTTSAPPDPPHHSCVSAGHAQCCHLSQPPRRVGCNPKPHLLFPKLACHIAALEPFEVVEALGQPLGSLAIRPAAVCQGVCAALVKLLRAAHVGVGV